MALRSSISAVQRTPAPVVGEENKTEEASPVLERNPGARAPAPAPAQVLASTQTAAQVMAAQQTAADAKAPIARKPRTPRAPSIAAKVGAAIDTEVTILRKQLSDVEADIAATKDKVRPKLDALAAKHAALSEKLARALIK